MNRVRPFTIFALLVVAFAGAIKCAATTFDRYVDYAAGSNSNAGSTGAPWLDLNKAASAVYSGLTSGDVVNVYVRNGQAGTPGDSSAFLLNDSAWAGVTVNVRADTGHNRYKIGGSVGYAFRMIGSSGKPTLVDIRDAEFTPTAASIFFQSLTGTAGTIGTSINVSNCILNGTATNTIQFVQFSVGTSGNITVSNCTANYMPAFVTAQALGNITLRSNTFNHTTVGGAGVIFDFKTSGGTGAIGNITSVGNTWNQLAASSNVFFNRTPLITSSDKVWLFYGDKYNFHRDASSGKWIDLDDVDASSTNKLTIKLHKVTAKINSSNGLFTLGKSVNASYTNAQKPRAKTLSDDCTKKLGAIEIIRCDLSNVNNGANAAVLTLRCGITSGGRIEGNRVTAPNSLSHTNNFLCNGLTIRNNYLQGELPCLLYGDNHTVEDNFIKGTRPIVGGKTGGGLDESSQGHTIRRNVLWCTDISGLYAALDDYDWQANNPYGSTWYSSTDTDGTQTGIDWIVDENVLIANKGGYCVSLANGGSRTLTNSISTAQTKWATWGSGSGTLNDANSYATTSLPSNFDPYQAGTAVLPMAATPRRSVP